MPNGKTDMDDELMLEVAVTRELEGEERDSWL
jgi:hypothetical protein